MKNLGTEYLRTIIQYGNRRYSGPKWAREVSTWPESKVRAVYYSFLKRGLLGPYEKMEKQKDDQISLFDIYGLNLENIK